MSSLESIQNVDVAEIRSMLQQGQSIEPELQEIFCEEAADHLRVIYDGLARLQTDGNDRAALGDVRRATHTLKGAAGAVGVQSATRLSHRMEDLLDDLVESGRALTPQTTSLFLSTADRLQELTTESFELDLMADKIAELYQQYFERLPSAGVNAASESVQGCSPSDVAYEESDDDCDEELEAALAAFGVDLDDDDDLIDESQALETANDHSPTSDGSRTADQLALQKSPAPRKEEPPAATVARSENHIRVPLSRLDQMVRLVGEMIINRSAFAQRLSDFSEQIDDLDVAMNRLKRVSDEIETRYSVQALKQGNSCVNGLVEITRLTNEVSESGAHRDFDELEFDRYNEFHLLTRSLAEATEDVASIGRECRMLSADFDTLVGRSHRLIRDAQEGLLQIRMVPLGNVIPRLGRAIRSTASECGKCVQLEVRGDHAELDKTVLEEIADPLLHLVRNAVDHGVETPQQRIDAGKPAEAKLTIEAINQGTSLTIRVEDDGRGLDTERIRRQAIGCGLIESDDSLTTDQLHRLIFAPGFSTADQITDISGRGVGMDVVREAVARLKGTIRVESTAGKGVRFTIMLPTSLAVTRALIVGGSGSSFALPMQAIRQISKLDLGTLRLINDDPVVDLDQRTMRVCRLTDGLGITARTPIDSTMPMLIVESGDRRIALLVDEIQGGHDIVVKSLGDHLRSVPGVLGATVRGDGSVIPILEPADLVRFARNMNEADRCAKLVQPVSPHMHRRRVMIVDDSVSVRRVTAGVMGNGGWSVTTAKDGVDALEQIAGAEQLPDLILLDMEMPRMNGLELLSHLQSSEQYQEIPIVMVTSRAGEKHRRRAIQAGASDYVVKPFRDEQLLELAARLVDQVAARESSQ